MTREMTEWLAANIEPYERFLLHALLHNPDIRRQTLDLVTHKDMSSDAMGLTIAGLKVAVSVHEQIGTELPFPPELSAMIPHLRAAAAQHDFGPEDVRSAMKLLVEMQDPALASTHIYVEPYFSAWFTTVRAKSVARSAQRNVVVNADKMVETLQHDIEQASRAFKKDTDRNMRYVLFGEETEPLERTSTGIPGLDACMNGGTCDGEAYGIFAPTGGGKSILAGQLALNRILRKKHVLIVTTELQPYEYVGRMASAALTIPIPMLADCTTVNAMRQAIKSCPRQSKKLDEFNELVEQIATYLSVQKIDPEEAKSAASALETQYKLFADAFDAPPTLVILDWLGSLADQGGGGKLMGSSERSAVWEMSASGICRWAARRGPATFYLLQATNDSETKAVLTRADIGVGKGVLKDAIMGIGVTACIDMAALKQAALGKAEAPRDKCRKEQLFCVVKARKGEEFNVPVTREFLYQRFVERHSELPPRPSPMASSPRFRSKDSWTPGVWW